MVPETEVKISRQTVGVGKEVVDVVTAGMYSNPLMALREYVQNAVDAIDQAVVERKLGANDGYVCVTLDGSRRVLSVCDNGIGISNDKAGPTLCYPMVAFAVCSGLWNTVMIINSEQVKKQQICHLFKGHLDDEIAVLFEFIKKAQQDLRAFKVVRAEDVKQPDPPAEDHRSAETTRMQSEFNLYIFFRYIIMNPHRILLPYLFVIHVVALNFVLAVFIALSTALQGGEGLAQKVPLPCGLWAIKQGDNPKMRVALCGYAGKRIMPDSWECLAWKAHGGYGSQSKQHDNPNASKECIWFSPHCLTPAKKGFFA